MRIAYLHGFASGPQSAKGTLLAAALAARPGVSVHLPDLNRPSFRELTFSRAISAVDELVAAHPAEQRWHLIGSSMGGWLAARWAELHPEAVERLVLLCPAFDLLEHLPRALGRPGLLAEWERAGSIRLGYGPDGPSTEVDWSFAHDARDAHPARPALGLHPTLIMHGMRDEVIPVESSRRAVRELEVVSGAAPKGARCAVVLEELDDDHALLRTSAHIAERCKEWLMLP